MRVLVAFLVALLISGFTLPAPASAKGDIVSFRQFPFPPGTIIVRTAERKLYLLLPDGKAIRYPIAVGRAGMQWQGMARIVEKRIKPAWAPPPPEGETWDPKKVIAGGSPANPMGAAAMVLTGRTYAIHGTNEPWLIGQFVSHGCIRMYNADVLTLYKLAPKGTLVVVLR